MCSSGITYLFFSFSILFNEIQTFQYLSYLHLEAKKNIYYYYLFGYFLCCNYKFYEPRQKKNETNVDL